MSRRMPIASLLAVAVMSVAACSVSWGNEGGGDAAPASGTGDTRRYAVRDFDAVSLGAVGDVEVRVGGDWSVAATGKPALLDQLIVARDGDTLKLTRRNGVRWSGGDRVRFVVTMPRIARADIGGAGSIVVDRVPAGSFAGNIGGSGRLDVRNLMVDEAQFSVGGSGTVRAAGRARALAVNIGGSGDVQAAPLSTEHAEITVAGSGNVAATASRTAAITMMGSGDVTIAGGARCSTTKMGSGTVRCG